MSRGFATTQWSVVLAAKDGGETAARRALESLCEAYWYPLYVYLRSHRHAPEEASDLTQAFFAELLERDRLRAVDPAKGRFRSFLLASLQHFVARQREGARAGKRGGGAPLLSIDAAQAEARFGIEPADELTPEQVFERRWGLTMMERAMGRLEAESTSSGAERFTELKAFITDAGSDITYRTAAERLGTTEGALRTAVHRLRRRYGALLREEIADTVADPAEVDDELRHLLRVVRPWHPPQPS